MWRWPAGREGAGSEWAQAPLTIKLVASKDRSVSSPQFWQPEVRRGRGWLFWRPPGRILASCRSGGAGSSASLGSQARPRHPGRSPLCPQLITSAETWSPPKVPFWVDVNLGGRRLSGEWRSQKPPSARGCCSGRGGRLAETPRLAPPCACPGGWAARHADGGHCPDEYWLAGPEDQYQSGSLEGALLSGPEPGVEGRKWGHGRRKSFLRHSASGYVSFGTGGRICVNCCNPV